MLTRSLDAVISATRALPDHLLVVRRSYSGSPAALSALGRLQDALIEVDRAIAGRTAEGPDTAPSPQRKSPFVAVSPAPDNTKIGRWEA